jgi:hypothetical protein
MREDALNIRQHHSSMVQKECCISTVYQTVLKCATAPADIPQSTSIPRCLACCSLLTHATGSLLGSVVLCQVAAPAAGHGSLLRPCQARGARKATVQPRGPGTGKAVGTLGCADQPPRRGQRAAPACKARPSPNATLCICGAGSGCGGLQSHASQSPPLSPPCVTSCCILRLPGRAMPSA